MNKKLLLLSALLLTSSIFTTSQNLTAEEKEAIENAEKNMILMEKVYESVTINHDQKKIKKLENNIEKAISDFIENNLKYGIKLTQTVAIEKSIDEFIEYLSDVSDKEQAFAAVSMLFIIKWSKLIEKKSLEIQTKEQETKLIKTIDKINEFIQIKFLEPLASFEEN